METNLVKIYPKEFGIAENQANEITKGLSTVLSERELLIKEFEAISTLEVTPLNLKMFKDLRVRIMKNRTLGIEAWHKVGKEYFLRGSQFVDAIKRKESQVNEQMESKLMESEKYFENLEKERIAKIRENRIAIMLEFCENPSIYPLGEMSETDFDNLVNGLDLAKKAKIKAEKEAKEAEEKLKIEAENERQRVIAENKQLKKIAEEKEKQIAIEREKAAKELAEQKAKADAEAKLLADKLAKEKAESERLAKIESDKQAELLKIEKEKAAKIAEELRQKQIAEEKLKQSQIDEEKRIAAEKKKAESAPDKAKLKEFAEKIVSLDFPEVKSKEAQKILDEVDRLLVKVSNYIIENSNKL